MNEKLNLSHLVFELTEACNQNCRFCYNHWRPEGCLPVDEKLAARTLRRLLKQTTIGNISFSGGEPTLLKNVHDMALKCRFKGCSVNVLTNGTLVSEDDISIFQSIGISALQVPFLSSNPAIHDYLTGLAGSWEKALHTILTALRVLGPEHYAAVLIVTARNFDGLAETLNLYRELGVRTIMVNRFNLGGNGLRNRDELSLSKEELSSAFKIISDFSLSNPEMTFVSGVCTPVCLIDPLDFPGIRFTNCSTDIKNRPVTVSFKGEVRFCNHSPFVLGNIWEKDIREILEDNSVIERYSGIPVECNGCKLFARCKGGCRAASEQVYGTFDRIDPVMEIQRLRFPYISV